MVLEDILTKDEFFREGISFQMVSRKGDPKPTPDLLVWDEVSNLPVVLRRGSSRRKAVRKARKLAEKMFENLCTIESMYRYLHMHGTLKIDGWHFKSSLNHRHHRRVGHLLTSDGAQVAWGRLRLECAGGKIVIRIYNNRPYELLEFSTEWENPTVIVINGWRFVKPQDPNRNPEFGYLFSPTGEKVAWGYAVVEQTIPYQVRIRVYGGTSGGYTTPWMDQITVEGVDLFENQFVVAAKRILGTAHRTPGNGCASGAEYIAVQQEEVAELCQKEIQFLLDHREEFQNSPMPGWVWDAFQYVVVDL